MKVCGIWKLILYLLLLYIDLQKALSLIDASVPICFIYTQLDIAMIKALLFHFIKAVA